MLKLNIFFFIAVVFVLFFSNCNKKNNQSPIYGSWGIAKNADNANPKFVLDWGFPRELKIKNISSIDGVGKIPDSVRLLVYYSFANPSVDSMEVNISTIATYLTKKLQTYNKNDVKSDSFGTNPVYNLNSCFVSQNYLTIPFSYYYSSPNIAHKISLVYDADNSLWNNSLDTMSVEFRHNVNGDIGSYSNSGTLWVAFNLNPQRQTSPVRGDSFFVKISYNTSSLSTGSEIKTIVVAAKWQ